MIKIRLLLILSLLTYNSYLAQQTEIVGKVSSTDNVENIHVLNKTSKQYTTTNSQGRFKMLVKRGDTLTFLSIQHKQKQVLINQEILNAKKINITLEERINELSEVILGKILTGDLGSDITTFEEKPALNFWDVGIPGYKGKPKTQSERRLYEATTGAGIIPLNPILNAISGRTKKLKKRVKLEAIDELMDKIISQQAQGFLNVYPLEKHRQMDFFYFCSEDETFEKRCKNKTQIEIFEFLKEKYNEYTANLQEQKN